MKPEVAEHLKGNGPMYALLAVILGGGGVATFTDNLPVTHGEFATWSESHEAAPHAGTTDELKKLGEALGTIRQEQLREQLKAAYKDKCTATGTALTYINNEIERLQGLYEDVAGRRYEPPPCQQ